VPALKPDSGCDGDEEPGTAPPYLQRPYDIHSSNAVESLVQLFSTVSVQYVPTWSKEMVALLRKVSPAPPPSPGGPPLLHSCPGAHGSTPRPLLWVGTFPDGDLESESGPWACIFCVPAASSVCFSCALARIPVATLLSIRASWRTSMLGDWLSPASQKPRLRQRTAPRVWEGGTPGWVQGHAVLWYPLPLPFPS
jgi:hypothetical protein